MSSSNRLPLLFVFLWSSGFIAFEFCSAHLEPATFVVIRTGLTANLIFLIIVCTKSGWPERVKDVVGSVIVGILIHGIYAGGLFTSIYRGIDVSLAALIMSLQPALTVLLSSIFLGEKLTSRKIFGVLAGLTGVSIVILENSTMDIASIGQRGYGNDSSFLPVVLCIIALIGISVATIVQKCHCTEIKLMPGAFIQYASAAIFMLPFAIVFETMQINWSFGLALSLSWLVLFVSIGAVSLLMLLIKHGEAGSVANLFYLVTPMVSVGGWLFFGDKLTVVSVFGMLICISGVIFVNCAPRYSPTSTPKVKRKRSRPGVVCPPSTTTT